MDCRGAGLTGRGRKRDTFPAWSAPDVRRIQNNPEYGMKTAIWKMVWGIFCVGSVGAQSIEAVGTEPDAVRPPPRVALFVANRAQGRPELDGEVDSLRAAIAAELAGEVAVVDPQDLAAAFRKGQISSAAEQNRLVEGVFTGGSVVQIAQMVDAEYVMVVTLNSADRFRFPSHEGFRTGMSVRVLDGRTGGAVDGFRVTGQRPIRGVGGEDAAFWRLLFEDAAEDIGRKVAENRAGWPVPMVAEITQGRLTVETPVDALLNGLSTGTRAPNDLLDEMRRVVGGVTVWVDGAVVGSSPGTFNVSRGLHTVRVTRAWMEPWEAVVKVGENTQLNVALELSAEGLRRWKSMESFKGHVALEYARALFTRGIEVNFDTTNWERVGGMLGQPVEVLLEQAP